MGTRNQQSKPKIDLTNIIILTRVQLQKSKTITMTSLPNLFLRQSLLHKSKLSSFRAAAGVTRIVTRTNMDGGLAGKDLDPLRIFDEVDTNGDGVISKDEFVQALNRLNYHDLVRTHSAAQSNAEQKLETIAQIEHGMKNLADAHAAKQEAYSNVGMMTGAEIDALFDRSQSHKDEIHTLIGDLRALISKSVYNGKDSFSNVGMMTSSEIDSFFPPDDEDKDEVDKAKAA